MGKSAEKPKIELTQGPPGLNLPNLNEARRMSPSAPKIAPPVSAAPVSTVEPSASATLPVQEGNWPMDFIAQKNRVGTGGEDLLSRNFNWGVPIVSLPGRAGMGLNLGLSLNSLIWTKSGTNMHFDLGKGFPSPGFRLGLPELGAAFYNTETGTGSMLVIMPSGRIYEFRENPALGSNVYEEMSGTRMLLVIKPNINYLNTIWTLLMTDGAAYKFKIITNNPKCIEIKDRNGNFISVTYTTSERIDTITETLGRDVKFRYDGSNRLTSITQNWSGGEHTYATFAYSNVMIQTNFPGLDLVGVTNGTTISALSRMDMADGKVYAFEYNTYAQVKTIRCFAPNSANPGNFPGDYTLLSSISYDLTPDAGAPQSDCPRFFSRIDWAKDWNSGVITTYAGDGATWGSATTPDGTIYKEFFGPSGWQRGLTVRTETWSSGSLKKWTTSTWANDNPTVSYWLNPRVVETNVYDGSNRRRTTIDYADFGSVSDIREYEANASTVLRHTHFEYLRGTAYTGNTSRRLTQLVTSQTVYDGSGALQSKITYDYDLPNQQDQQYLVHQGPPIRHDTAKFGPTFVQGRGNLNVVRRWDVTAVDDPDKSVASTIGYNTSGSMIFSRDPLGHGTSLSYTDSFSDSVNRNTLAYPTTMTDADEFSSTVQYNYDFGDPTRKQDPKGAVVVNTYDPIGRLSQVTDQVSGAYTRYVYAPNHLSVQSFTTINDLTSEFYRITIFDGRGGVRGVASDHPGSAGGYKAQNFEYDFMGNLVGQTNPTEINVNWIPAGVDAAGWVWRSQAYDWQRRPTDSTNQDGTMKEISYDGCGCAGGEVMTITDEGTTVVVPGFTVFEEAELVHKRRQQKVFHDILGRVSKVEEFRFSDPSGYPPVPENTIYRTTTYKYNARNQVVSVKAYVGEPTGDGSCPSGTCQETTMEYDGHGRLSARHKPIDAPNTNSLYEYYENDRLKKVTDPRGVVTNYTYYGRPLVKDVTYGAAAEVSANSPVHFEYDDGGNRTLMTDAFGEARYHYYNNTSRMQYETRQFNDIDVTTRIDYQYNTSGQLSGISVNATGTSLSYNYDKAGQMTSVIGSGYSGVSTFLSQAAYRASGAVKTLTYGNGRAMNYGYNSRLQVSHMDMPGVISSDYTYHEDGRIKEISSVDVTGGATLIALGRRYFYDSAGRLTNQQSPPYEDPPEVFGANGYDIAYGYNQFDNMARAVHAINSILGNGTQSSYVTTWLNNRNQDPAIGQDGYDNAGNMKRHGDRTYVYNSVGKPVSLSDLGLSYGYDGDSVKVKEVRTSPPMPTIPANLLNYTTYFVRSTVLGGNVVMELNGSGQRKWDYIYGVGGELLAEHNPTGQEMPGHMFGPRDIPAQAQGEYEPQIPPQPNKVLWHHADPGRAMAWTTRTDGSLIKKRVETFYTTYETREFDPTGSQVDYRYISYKYGLSSSFEIFSWPGVFVAPDGGNTYNAASGCAVDGVQTSCNTAMFIVNSGGAKGLVEIGIVFGGPPNTNPFGSDIIFTSYLDNEIEYEKIDPESGDLIGYGYLPIYRTELKLMNRPLVQDETALRRQIIINKAVIAAKRYLADSKCISAITHSFSDDDKRGNPGNPAEVLRHLDIHRQIFHGDDVAKNAIAVTRGTGFDAKIVISSKFFAAHTVGRYIQVDKGVKTLSLEVAQALTILHELAHATRQYGHGGLRGRFIYENHVSSDELDAIIYKNCIAGPLPNDKGGE